jgi:hypothetical protein
MAAPYEASRSVIIEEGRPKRFISFFNILRAAALSRLSVTTASSTSPS